MSLAFPIELLQVRAAMSCCSLRHGELASVVANPLAGVAALWLVHTLFPTPSSPQRFLIVVPATMSIPCHAGVIPDKAVWMLLAVSHIQPCSCPSAGWTDTLFVELTMPLLHPSDACVSHDEAHS